VPHILERGSNVKRLATRIIITDSMLTLLFKCPPQITVAEMCGDLPGADAAFEASTSAEFAELGPDPAYSKSQTRSLCHFCKRTGPGLKH
jgi:hypothetical protein